MDHRLLHLLVCPSCKGALQMDHETTSLVCAGERLAYPIRDGIPVMLVEEARNLDDAPAAPPATPQV